MDELSPLFQDIEFRERLRGYDVEEVDAYIDRIAKAAALVQGRIAELQQRAEAAEGRLSERAAPVEGEDTMSRILLLAQRTADAAVAEAQAEASDVLSRAHAEAASTRADADEYASRVLAEAETDRRQAVTDAESAAAEAIAHERERVADAIAELEQYRAFLAEDIDILERHLGASRAALNASLVGLTDLLEAPEAFRPPAMPATSGALAPASLAEPQEVVDEVAVPEITPDETDSVEETEESTPTGSIDPTDFEPLGEGSSDASPVTPWAAPTEAVDADTPHEPDAPTVEFSEVTELVESIAEVAEATPGPAAASDADDIDLTAPTIDLEPIEIAPIVEPPLLVTAADLDPAELSDEWVRDVHVDAGPVTEPVPVVADQLLFEDTRPGSATATAADPFLEQLREAVARDDADDFGDDALAAFFDGEGDDGDRSWFPRRR